MVNQNAIKTVVKKKRASRSANEKELVYFEVCPNVNAVIFREKQIKGGSRQ